MINLLGIVVGILLVGMISWGLSTAQTPPLSTIPTPMVFPATPCGMGSAILYQNDCGQVYDAPIHGWVTVDMECPAGTTSFFSLFDGNKYFNTGQVQSYHGRFYFDSNDVSANAACDFAVQ